MKDLQCSGLTAFCWMDCLDIPESCIGSPTECVNAENKPCCTDEITENCEAMDPTCKWQCQI